MTAGVFQFELEAFGLVGLSTGFTGIDLPAGLRGLADSDPMVGGGANTDVRPLPAFPDLGSSAAKVSSFLDDFYNRIHMTPNAIRFGPITSAVSRTVSVWNAYLEDTVHLTGMNWPGDAGLAVSGATLPATFKPLASRDYVLTALVEGPPSMNFDLEWAFDIPWSYDMPISGDRMKLWNIRPDW